MSPRRVVLAGAAGESAGRHHQRDMFAPAVQASELLTLAGVWPGPTSAEGHERAVDLAGRLGVPVLESVDEVSRAADAVVACADEATLDELVAGTRERALPVIVDKLAALGTSRLEQLAAGPDGLRVRGAYHPRFHPSVLALAGQAAAGAYGLPHALHGDLLVSHGDGPNADGDLRHVAVLALDVVSALLGPGDEQQSVHAVRHAGGNAAGDAGVETWTLTVRWLAGCVVTLLVSRGGPEVTETVQRYRLLASHGQAMLDLDAPVFRLVGAGTRAVPFGRSPVVRELEALCAGGAEPSLASVLRWSRLLDAAQRSAMTGALELPAASGPHT